MGEPYEVLDYIGEAIVKLELIKQLSRQAIYRGRFHIPDIKYTSVTDLGPPAPEKCVYSNRMSPAGIPMFYGAFDRDTVIEELIPGKKDTATQVTIGKFRLLKPINILDLSNIPSAPSIFDKENRHLRETIFFLRAFLRDLSKPVSKDGQENIDYVPTQIVTEYFRHVFQIEHKLVINGIVYPSSRNQSGKSLVLFYDQSQCVDASANVADKTIKLQSVETLDLFR